MGADIEGEGTSTVRVVGGARLNGGTRELSGDYIEAGSWAVVAAVTGGGIKIKGVKFKDLEPIISILSRMNVKCSGEDDCLIVHESRAEAVHQITTSPWPGFPSDMVSLVGVLATQAIGSTLVHDWMYELRLFALEQLSGMGANLFLCDPHRMIVHGPRRLSGRNLDTRDLRSGMALIAAALSAEGVSRVGPLETVERGYGGLVERLSALGGRVTVERPNST
jgi:UDP-N-acetylglucosamine 1-carboxyvinyltransferase